jgi:apolipoprotein D and lipocalin family protein
VTLRALALLFLVLGCTENAPLDVAKVDLERFQGTWHEIEKIPRATQADCTGTTATYRLKSSTELDVFNQCRLGELTGPANEIGARGVVTDPDEPAKLSVDFGGFFGDLWIVDVADDYRFAAVGHPSRDYLWILSRTTTLADSDRDALHERLTRAGFDVSRLELTVQPAPGESATPLRPASELPSASEHGCAMSPPPEVRNGVFGLALLAAVVLLGARRRALKGRIS